MLYFLLYKKQSRMNERTKNWIWKYLKSDMQKYLFLFATIRLVVHLILSFLCVGLSPISITSWAIHQICRGMSSIEKHLLHYIGKKLYEMPILYGSFLSLLLLLLFYCILPDSLQTTLVAWIAIFCSVAVYEFCIVTLLLLDFNWIVP